MKLKRDSVWLGVAAAVVIGGASTVASMLPPALPEDAPFEAAPRAEPPKPLTWAEEVAYKEAIKAKLRADGSEKVLSGPETRGASISVGGHEVQLPADAYVAAFIVHVDCLSAGSCPEVPYYVIERGKSLMKVAVRSGNVIERRTAPGEENLFAFLNGIVKEGDR